MLKLRKKNYKLYGVKKHSIELWRDSLKDDIRIFSHSNNGKNVIEILMHLNIIEAIKVRLSIINYNLKHRNNLRLVRVGARH